MRREKCADEGGRLGPTLPQHKAFIHVAPPPYTSFHWPRDQESNTQSCSEEEPESVEMASRPENVMVLICPPFVYVAFFLTPFYQSINIY